MQGEGNLAGGRGSVRAPPIRVGRFGAPGIGALPDSGHRLFNRLIHAPVHRSVDKSRQAALPHIRRRLP